MAQVKYNRASLSKAKNSVKTGRKSKKQPTVKSRFGWVSTLFAMLYLMMVVAYIGYLVYSLLVSLKRAGGKNPSEAKSVLDKAKEEVVQAKDDVDNRIHSWYDL